MKRCWWPGDDELYVRYHDEEWGRPVVDDRRLFEKICLEGFQSGLSWLTILRKRENFRTAFKNFDPDVEIGSGSTDVLLGAYHTGSIDMAGDFQWFVQGLWQHHVATQHKTRPRLDFDTPISNSIATELLVAGHGT